MAGVFELVYGLSGIVVILMVLLISIAYMASKLFNLPQLEVFAKVELYEVFISIMILLVAQGFFQTSEALSNSIAGGNAFDIAREYHARIVQQGIYPALHYSYQMITIFSILNTFQIRPNDSVWTWTYKVTPAADMFVGMFNLLVYGLITVMGALNGHMFILAFIEATMYNFFLPAGVLMRFFPPTRQAGVFLIVLAIAFYSVYPTIFALHLSVLDDIAKIEGCDDPSSPDCDEFYDPFSESLAYEQLGLTMATPFVVGTILGGQSKLIDSAPAIVQGFVGFIASEAFLMILEPQIFEPVLRAIAALSLVTFFLPALSMVITIAFVTGVTNFIERRLT